MIPRPLLITAGALIVVLVGAGLIAERLTPRPTTTETRTRTETTTQAVSRTDTETQETLRALTAQLAEMRAQVATRQASQADVATRTVERIERYLPAPAVPSSPAPVVVRGGEASQVPIAVPTAAPQVVVQPIEVITRTTETVDRTKSESASTSDTTSKSAATTDTAKTTDTTKSETASSKTVEKSETTVKTATGEHRSEGGRLGVGITSQAQPFVSYDLARVSLGPKVLGLGKLSAGLFVTKPLSGGSLDGGPQANVTVGRSRVFGMVGYQVREKTPIVGLGVKF